MEIFYYKRIGKFTKRRRREGPSRTTPKDTDAGAKFPHKTFISLFLEAGRRT